ncbi:hypothetical protein FRC01_002922, partial [Tulasnella sp. 417]
FATFYVAYLSDEMSPHRQNSTIDTTVGSYAISLSLLTDEQIAYLRIYGKGTFLHLLVDSYYVSTYSQLFSRNGIYTKLWRRGIPVDHFFVRASNQQLQRNKDTYAQTVGYKSAQECGKKHNRKRNTKKFEGDISDAQGRYWLAQQPNYLLQTSPAAPATPVEPRSTPQLPRTVLSPDYDPRYPQTLAKSSKPRRFVAKTVVKDSQPYDATLLFRHATEEAKFLRLVELSNQAYDRAETPRILHPSGIASIRRYLSSGIQPRLSSRRALKRAVRTRTSPSAKNLITS